MITANQIMHPEDQKALSVLKKIPFIDDICRTTMEIGYESIFRGENLGMMLKIDSTYKADIYKELETVTKILGIDTPELYVYNDPVMNAFTYGETSPSICVSSSLIEKLTPTELRAVLAHECGHILCKHVLYGSVVETLRELGHNLGILKYSLTGAVELALNFWSRRSELSADRCSAAVVGIEAAQSALLKLSAGLSDVGNDPYRLVKQAKEYHQHEKKDIWHRIQQNCRVAFYSHPQIVNRAYELDRWKDSYVYRKLHQK